ncbi:hypothetical protein [Streptomyces sp. NPDC000878]
MATVSGGGPKASRRRGAALESAILRTAWAEVNAVGMAGLTMERNARRALGGQPSGRLTDMVGEPADTAAGTRRLLEQPAVRLRGSARSPTCWCSRRRSNSDL